jgi:hypothetical protein
MFMPMHLIAFKHNKYSNESVVFMNAKSCILTVSTITGIIGLVLTPFGLLLGVPVSAQQQTTQAENHHPNSGSNQSSINSTAEQRQNTTTVGGGMMSIINQTFTTRWMSLVDGVKVSGISIIDNEHIAINLSYDGKGESPGVSVVAITNSSFGTIISSMMQNSTTSASNSSVRVMQSGSNYLEAGWQVQYPNSATVLVQLDGDIPEGGHIMVIVVPFLHH